MKLSDFKGEAAIDLLADLVEPVTEIMTDAEVIAVLRDKTIKRYKAVSKVLKLHSKEVLEIAARLDGVPVEEYKCTVLSLTSTVLDILNDSEMISFFAGASQPNSSDASGCPTENTEDGEN